MKIKKIKQLKILKSKGNIYLEVIKLKLLIYYKNKTIKNPTSGYSADNPSASLNVGISSDILSMCFYNWKFEKVKEIFPSKYYQWLFRR